MRIVAIIAAALIATVAHTQPLAPPETAPGPEVGGSPTGEVATPEAARRAKCSYLWARVAPWSYSPDLVEFFVAEHERRGIGHEWLASMTYGMANFGLTVGKRVGPCYGPMDVRKEYARKLGYKPADLLRPRPNIECHVDEMLTGYKKGYRGIGLCRYVMFPARPHDWGKGRFRKMDARLRWMIAEGYECGKLPAAGQPPVGGTQ